MKYQLTEMTQIGDPMMRIRLPKAIHQGILGAIKKNKRKPQDELIKRLALTFRENEKFEVLQKELLLQLSKIFEEGSV